MVGFVNTAASSSLKHGSFSWTVGLGIEAVASEDQQENPNVLRCKCITNAGSGVS